MKALGMLGDDAAAISAWASTNKDSFDVVEARYADTIKTVRTAINTRLDELAEPAAEEVAQ